MDLITALSAEHYEEIVVGSCVDPSVASARGYRTLTGTQDERQELEDIGFGRTLWDRDDAYPLLLIPMHGADGTVRGHQVKPSSPRKRVKADGTPVPVKYETPPKTPVVVDVPEYTRSVMHDLERSLWITEGMKKTDALVSHGQAALGLTGVFNWRNSHGTLGDWEEIPLKGRPVVICFDSDAAGNRNVQMAMGRLGAWLRTRGVSKVHYLVVPAQVEGTDVKGVDDFFAAGGTVEALAAAATQTAPGAGEKDASFTDAFLVEELAEALEGRFCWASGLGWLRWTGRTWKEVSDVEPLEAVRVWASEQFEKALTAQRQDPSKPLGGSIQGWRMILGKSRLTALRDLAKGTPAIQRDATEFDGDPDLLTVLNGTLHLPSGTLLPFDPAHCITKSADAEYRRGYVHPMWTAALRAIPGELHEWYQDRLGQALTGYPTPDHTLVIGCGTGSNGKSTVANTVRRTMGGYGVMVSDRVLMASADAHPTELMDFRGARYAIMEETPEARHLNVQRLKNSVGTPSIKARHIRQDTVEFLTSHSLFINTNYKPTVTETDWGTWRRLALMTYPFTFKKPGQTLESPWDRTGDPRLEYAANDPEVRSAALAWMAEGAREWYRRGRMMLPHPGLVEKDTREWRSETDLVLGFADECLRFTPEAFTQTRDMLTAFNEWAGERGHRPWNDRTFATRFGDHDQIRGHKVKQGRFTVSGKQQRGWSGAEIRKDGRDPMTGERDEPPAPEPDWDASCLADPDGPEGPDRPYGIEFWSGTDPSAPDPGTPGMVVTRLDECGNAMPSPDAKPQVSAPTGWHDVPEELIAGRYGSVAPATGLPYPPEYYAERTGVRPEPDPPYGIEFWSGTDPSAPDPGAPGMVVTRLDGCGNATPPEPSPDAKPQVNALDELTALGQEQNPAGYGVVALGLDLETASADQLFTGGHEGPFVRLMGAVDWHSVQGTDYNDVELIGDLNNADVVYGHNILGFDLLALAHHHGADYDALAAKAVDTQAVEYLVDPPLSKGMPNGYYKLDTLAQRYGVPGKTHDLAALARKWGGYDKIPVDDQDYNDYLRGDLAATKAVWEAQQLRVKEMGLETYAAREMAVVALQNRVTLNGWAVDVPLLEERAATEDAKRLEAIKIMARDYGVPTHYPDRFKLLPKKEMPEPYRSWPMEDLRGALAEDSDTAEHEGFAVRIPGEPRTKPWSSNAGKAALIKAFNDAGAPHVPRTPKSNELTTSADALGEKGWYCPERKRVVKGMLHPDAYGHLPGVRAVCEVLALATGARAKYAEMLPYVTAQGRVHPEVGAAQGSGRWAYVKPSTSTMGKRGAAAAERDVLVADPGHMMLTSDHSQLDVRTVAALSQDPELIKMLQPGMDYHADMAEVYCGDRDQRDGYKPVSHGTNYGQGALAIALRNGLPLGMVETALHNRGEKFHVQMDWTEDVRQQAASGRLLDNGFGRLMRADPERAYTQAPALMGQGASRDVMAESMLRLDRISGGRVRPFLRGVIHDEIVLSVPEGEVVEWQEMLREAMTWEWRGVPILCDVSMPAFRWSECK